MALFSWDDGLSVDNEMIDNDHQRMIDLFNELHDAMGEGQGEQMMGDVLAELLDYSANHFRREEEYMHKLTYVGFTAHKKEHQYLLQQVEDLQTEFKAGTLIMAVPTLHILRDWLVNHILKSDRALADTIRKMEA
jgi:hemerythrin